MPAFFYFFNYFVCFSCFCLCLVLSSLFCFCFCSSFCFFCNNLLWITSHFGLLIVEKNQIIQNVLFRKALFWNLQIKINSLSLFQVLIIIMLIMKIFSLRKMFCQKHLFQVSSQPFGDPARKIATQFLEQNGKLSENCKWFANMLTINSLAVFSGLVLWFGFKNISVIPRKNVKSRIYLFQNTSASILHIHKYLHIILLFHKFWLNWK